MVRRRIATIADVAEGHLCTGCGVCAAVQPDDLEMVDDYDHGRRPLAKPGREGADTGAALAACPGHELGHGPRPEAADAALWEGWGPVLEVWEGYAADPEIRFRGSSGGAATALALHGITDADMHGVLHIRQRHDVAYLNETVISTTRDELVAATGSRYAAASPGEGLADVKAAPGPSVMLGKPCDIAGARKAADRDPDLDAKLGLTVAIFCAGTPNARATVEMAKRLGVSDPNRIESVRYRGNGWPGNAVVVGTEDGARVEGSTTYADSWGTMLQQHRQWRCYVCIDHTGEFADISVGDPWYRDIEEGDPGRSLVIVRTERGRRFLADAIAAGHLDVERVSNDLLPASQPNLLETRGSVFGRILALRLAGVRTPKYRNMAMFSIWWRDLSMKARISSVGGTLTRVRRKKLYRRSPVVPFDPATFVDEVQSVSEPNETN